MMSWMLLKLIVHLILLLLLIFAFLFEFNEGFKTSHLFLLEQQLSLTRGPPLIIFFSPFVWCRSKLCSMLNDYLLTYTIKFQEETKILRVNFVTIISFYFISFYHFKTYQFPTASHRRIVFLIFLCIFRLDQPYRHRFSANYKLISAVSNISNQQGENVA